MIKNLHANADLKDVGSTPGSGRSPGKGNGNPLQYYCLENPMDRGVWCATLMGLQKLDKLKQPNTHKELIPQSH